MSYRENLGRVKVDKGKIYVPHFVERNGRRYITWGEPIDEPIDIPADIDITPKIYIPTLNDNGDIYFTLTDAIISEDNPNAIPLSTSIKNIKGPQGAPGAVNTVWVNPDIDYQNMSQYKKEGQIYIQNGIASVYDAETNKFYDLDDLTKFNDYYTKTETHTYFYDKTAVDNKLGNIEQCQEAILYTLDKGSVNIPSGD